MTTQPVTEAAHGGDTPPDSDTPMPPVMQAAEVEHRALMAEAEAERLAEENARLRSQLEQANQATQPAPTEPNYGNHLNDPRFPAHHPRNNPNDAAYKVARKERERREKSSQVEANQRLHGNETYQASQQEAFAARLAEQQQAMRARLEAKQKLREQLNQPLPSPEDRRLQAEQEAAQRRTQARQSIRAKNQQVQEATIQRVV